MFYNYSFYYNVDGNKLVTRVFIDMVINGALMLLPTLLPEAAVTCLSSEKGRKRSYWKPSIAESMANFVDIKEVNTEFHAFKALAIILCLYAIILCLYMFTY